MPELMLPICYSDLEKIMDIRNFREPAHKPGL